jgi:hypothetical protein
MEHQLRGGPKVTAYHSPMVANQIGPRSVWPEQYLSRYYLRLTNSRLQSHIPEPISGLKGHPFRFGCLASFTHNRSGDACGREDEIRTCVCINAKQQSCCLRDNWCFHHISCLIWPGNFTLLHRHVNLTLPLACTAINKTTNKNKIWFDQTETRWNAGPVVWGMCFNPVTLGIKIEA